jgi:hypothetical protein
MNETLKPWEPMQLTPVGNVGNVLQAGGGKLSPSTADPGDIRKPSGLG